MEEKLSFDRLPEKVSAIFNKLERIESMLKQNHGLNSEMEDEIFTIDQASDFTSLAIQTIYGLVSDKKIPFIKRKGSKRLYFSKNDLREWIMTGRKTRKSYTKSK